MKYNFTRVMARIEITFGVLIILAGIALAGMAAALPASWAGRSTIPVANELLARYAGALVVFSVGLVIGASFIVGGQITLFFLVRRVAPQVPAPAAPITAALSGEEQAARWHP